MLIQNESPPPQNADAETAVLGAVIDSDVIESLQDILQPEDFYSTKHQIIYRAMLDMHTNGVPIEILTLYKHLKNKKQDTSIGGYEYLMHLTEMTATAANCKYYATNVKECAKKRKLLEHLSSTTSEIQDGSLDYDKAYSKVLNFDDGSHSIKNRDKNGITFNYPKPLSEYAFYGLAGDIVKLIQPESEADPAALLVNFLTCYGNQAGNKPHFLVGADRHPVNLFCVLVGTTSKGHSFGFIEKFFKAIDEDWVNRKQTGLSTGEGLISSVRDEVTKSQPVKENGRIVDYEDVVVDEGVADKRLLVLESEFASTLKVANREGNTLSPTIRNAWDGSNLQTMSKNSPCRATGAHISIIGHITKDELLKYLTSTESSNGFGNRFLWLCVKRSKLLAFGGEFDKVNIEPYLKRLKKALEFAQEVEVIKWAEDTKPLWAEIYPQLSEGKPGLVGSLTARAEAYVTRIASIYAILDLSDEIRPEHLKAAVALFDYVEESVKYIFQDALGEPLADKIYNLLQDNSSGLDRTEISGRLGRNYKSSEITDALNLLKSLELADVLSENTGGRPKEIWISKNNTTYELNEINERMGT